MTGVCLFSQAEHPAGRVNRGQPQPGNKEAGYFPEKASGWIHPKGKIPDVRKMDIQICFCLRILKYIIGKPNLGIRMLGYKAAQLIHLFRGYFAAGKPQDMLLYGWDSHIIL